jgi:hypothetical protein
MIVHRNQHNAIANSTNLGQEQMALATRDGLWKNNTIDLTASWEDDVDRAIPTTARSSRKLFDCCHWTRRVNSSRMGMISTRLCMDRPMCTPSIAGLLRACDQLEPPRLVVRMIGPDAFSVRKLRFPGPFAVVGSHPTADITLAEPALRPRHYYLQAIGSKVHTIALGRVPLESIVSLREPKANLAQPAGLSCDRQETSFSFEGRAVIAQPDRPRVTAKPECPDQLAWPVLKFRLGSVVDCWRPKRTISLIGSAPGCTARLRCPGVSSIHCSVLVTPQGLWVVDLLGEIDCAKHRGTFVNGELVRYARIEPGDVLQIGDFEVQIREPGLSSEPSQRFTETAITSRAVSSPPIAQSREPEVSQPMLGSVLRLEPLTDIIADSPVREFSASADDTARRRLGFVSSPLSSTPVWPRSMEA